MNKKDIDNIFNILSKIYNDNSLIELKYDNPYTLLVSVVLSAQATDEGVNKATKDLFKIANTPKKMLKLGQNKLNEHIKTINYHNVKSKHIIELSKILIEKYNSIVPDKREDLESLPGVGRKTANVVLNILFNQNCIAVDTHVFRVSNRIGIVNENNVYETEMNLYKNVPKRYVKYVNTWLVLFGRYICKAKNPNCNKCPINKYCKYFNNSYKINK